MVANRRIRIVFLSMHPDVVYVSEAFQAGGSAYVLKSYFPMTKIIMAASPLQMNWREERRLAMDRA